MKYNPRPMVKIGLITLLGCASVVWYLAVRFGRSDVRVALPRRALAPSLGPTPPIGPEFERLCGHLKGSSMATLGNMLHALHVFGNAEGDDYSCQAILDAVTNESAAIERFGGKSPYIRSTASVRVRLVDIKYLSQDFAEAEHHPGQMLAMLGAAGIPADQKIRFADGSTATLASIRDGLVHGFDMQGEIYWQISALAYYLAETSWMNKYGEHYTFDSAAEELLRRAPDDSPCLGLHKPLTLATLAVLDEGRHGPLLSREVRLKVDGYLAEVVSNAEKRQSPAGDWGADWWSDAPSPVNPLEREDARLIARLTATGHLVELFAQVSPHLRASSKVVDRAKAWIGGALAEKTSNPEWIARNYCPVSHAYKAYHTPAP